VASIRDVAREAKVSVTTVSRVLNDSSAVTDDKRRRVERVIRKLAYRPNPSARALRSNRTNLIALIIPEMVNPYFSAIVQGVQDVARRAGFQLILCNSGGEQSLELDYLEMLPHKRVDGCIITPPGLNSNPAADSRLLELGRLGYPFVSLGRRLNAPELCFDFITTDTAVGTQEAMRHLLENGHTRIAYFGGPENVATTRLKVYLSALSARGLVVRRDLIFTTDLTLEAGYRLGELILKSPAPPTAVLAVNDMVAIGAVLALQEHDVRVPEQVSVIGFDDIPLASIIRPNLTTVAQPKYDLGRLAAERLIVRLQGSTTKFETISLSTHLIVRESTRSILSDARVR
jgi:LacI family transcriptional regulator